MKKITIQIQDNSLIFKYRTNKPVPVNLLNTNVISNNELVFSDEYIKENTKLVGLFLCDLAKMREITEIKISCAEITLLVFDIIAKMSTINSLTIIEDEVLSYELCEKISKTKNIKMVNCYSIPEFLIELLDKNNIKAESRNEVLFTSNFMSENNLNSFSKIYYKTNIKIPDVLLVEDLKDIETFFSINKYLKVIHFDKYSEENLLNVINVLKRVKRKNLSIQLHDDIDDENDIIRLRNINKELKRKYKIKISLIYSNDYLEKNYVQQIIFTTLKICASIIFLIIASVLGYIFYNNYNSELKVNKIKEDINETISEETNKDIETVNKSYFVPGSYDTLLAINKEMVGWIIVPGTKIDYPVVQAKDNGYYLNHNFYGEDDFAGWLFMDYRNNPVDLNDNTIVFGHNRFSSGVMFGTLQKLRKKSFFEKEENNYITYNTMQRGYKWRIFSVYGIKVTNDYLYNTFLNDADRLKFFNKLKKRSQIKFDVELTAQDKILTLSTCLDNNYRLVVHAVLVEETTMQQETSQTSQSEQKT